MEIFVHSSMNGFNRLGHVDIYFDNKVYSYGNYDDSSKVFLEMIGDGVVFITDKEHYNISHNVDNQIDIYEEIKLLNQFHNICSGGDISYLDISKENCNTIIKFIYDNIQCVQLNIKEN